MTRTTIKDIAKKLNISASTVSRALNNYQYVNPETRQKVQEMADQLDYQPDSLAQSLQKQRSNIIGVVVPQVKHVFFASVVCGITDIAYRAGYTVMICQSNEDYKQEVINIQTLMRQRVAGFLISVSRATTDFNHFESAQKQGVPIVFFDRVCENIEASKVVVDDYKGAFNATQHLIDCGYRRIAHLAGTQDIFIGRERFRGYRDALKHNEISFDPNLVVFCGFNEEDGVSAIDQLLSQYQTLPDAIFAVTDPVAIGTFLRLRLLNYKIPDDIGIVGFSDNPIASLIDPPLTTVRQPAYEIGKSAAEILLDHIENNSTEIVHKVLKTELIVRKSTKSSAILQEEGVL